MSKIKVLFLCIHNSARSQMAEAYLKEFGAEKFEAESAGLEPGKLNPLAIEVMRNDGIDISKNQTKDVFSLHKNGHTFNYVITVCDAKNAERCPVFPGLAKKMAWDFDDPSQFTGTTEEKIQKTQQVRDSIKNAVKQFIEVLNRETQEF